MSEQRRRDRAWEHWPGRKEPDDRMRHKLKALFAPTESEDAVEELIIERGREIEERTEQLHVTIADLERREEQTGRLRSAVEEMLRHGSAELDERHAELAALALQLGAREEQIRAADRDLALRKQELGAVELRSAAVERREGAATGREEKLEGIAAELTSRELQLAEAETRLAELETEIGDRQRTLAASQASVIERAHQLGDEETALARLATELAEREQLLESASESASVTAGREQPSLAVADVPGELRPPHRDDDHGLNAVSHILYVPGDRYRMVDREGRAPGIDALVEVGGREFVVTRVGRSPLPDDHRACAYLEPVGPTRQP